VKFSPKFVSIRAIRFFSLRSSAFLCVSAVLFQSVVAFSCSALAQDWPQFLGPHANGISDETGLLDKWPTNGPPLIWEKKIGTGYGAPSIRGDLLVFHHGVGDEEIIESLEAGTGK